ncbi:MAG TPA: glycosyltransferase family 4 protein [Rhodocyclaceae bacterium]
MERPIAIVLSPSRDAMSGVSTHLNLMVASQLSRDFALIHFQVGSEGRRETPLARLWRLLAGPLLLALRILASDADVVHINTSLNRRAWWRDLGHLLAAKACGARVVYQVHGGALPQRFARLARVPEALLRRVLELPDAVVVLASCEFSAYRSFLPGQNVLAVPNAIDVRPFRPELRPRRQAGDPLRLVSIGRLAPEKGLAEALEGLAMARRRGVEATLAIAGSGPLEAELRRQAARLGLGDAVRFVGPVFDAAKAALLQSADALVLPSHFEGLPYALLEGMAAGLPVITTRVGAIPDVVEHGVHGFFVAIRSPRGICRAIERLARDRALVAVMGLAGRRRVLQRHSLDRLADEFAQLYRSVCARPAAPAGA